MQTYLHALLGGLERGEATSHEVVEDMPVVILGNVPLEVGRVGGVERVLLHAININMYVFKRVDISILACHVRC